MSAPTPDAIAAVLDRHVHPLIGRSLMAAGPRLYKALAQQLKASV